VTLHADPRAEQSEHHALSQCPGQCGHRRWAAGWLHWRGWNWPTVGVDVDPRASVGAGTNLAVAIRQASALALCPSVPCRAWHLLALLGRAAPCSARRLPPATGLTVWRVRVPHPQQVGPGVVEQRLLPPGLFFRTVPSPATVRKNSPSARSGRDGPAWGSCRGSCTGGAAPRETPAFYMIMSACATPPEPPFSIVA
jgi:hypothetical protein